MGEWCEYFDTIEDAYRQHDSYTCHPVLGNQLWWVEENPSKIWGIDAT